MDENMSVKYEIEDVRRRSNVEHVLVNSVYRANSQWVPWMTKWGHLQHMLAGTQVMQIRRALANISEKV